MNAARLSRLLADGVAAAEEHLSALEAAYQAALKTAGIQASRRFERFTVDHLTADAINPGWTPPENDQLLNQTELAADASRRAKAAHQGALKAVLEPVLTDIGITYDLRNPFVARLASKLGARAADLGDAIRNDIAKTILASYQDGLSVAATAKAIRAAVDDISPVRATMLARTDLIGLANGASLAAAQLVSGDGQVGFKQWLATEDERTRETHADADGQVVPVDQPFEVGGEQLMYPGDPDGSDAEVCNCRCTLVYLDASDVAGTAGDLAAAAGPDVASLAMIAVYPREAEASALAIDGGLPAEDLHCTLLFLGDAEALDVPTLNATVAAVARDLPPLAGVVGGAAHFAEGPDGYPSIVLPDVPGLSTLQESVRASLAISGIDSPSEHGFTPHITLAYVPEPRVPDAAILGRPVHLDAVSVVIAKQRTNFALTGEPLAAAGVTPTDAVASRGRMDESPDATLTADVTVTVSEDAAPDAEMAAAPVKWRAILCVEGEPSQDGPGLVRMLKPGGGTWRDLPLSLGVMFETPHSDDAHAEVCGRIDSIYRDAADARIIWGEGEFNADEVGAKAAEMVGNLSLRGVSIDPYVALLEVTEPPVTDGAAGEPQEVQPTLLTFAEYVIGGATICPFQALESATISIVPDAEGEMVQPRIVTASCFVLTKTVIQPLEAAGSDALTTAAFAKLDELAETIADHFGGLRAMVEERDERYRRDVDGLSALVAAAVDEAAVPKQTIDRLGRDLAGIRDELTRRPRTVQFERDAEGKLLGLREA